MHSINSIIKMTHTHTNKFGFRLEIARIPLCLYCVINGQHLPYTKPFH